MLDRTFKLSSNWSLLHEECIRLKNLFLQLAYPGHLIHSMICSFITSKQTSAPPSKSTPDLQSVRIVLPFKEQKSADSVRKLLKELGKLLNIDLSPGFISRKVGEDLKHKEIKPALINEQSLVCIFECGWCDASYVGYTRRHLYSRSSLNGHSRKRTTLLTAALFETPFLLPYKLCSFTFS